MSALGGGFNRSTQHSISFFLLGFESQGLCTLPAIPKVPVFSAAVEPRKYPRRIVAHSIFPIQDRECCVDRLNRQSLADMPSCSAHVAFGVKADMTFCVAKCKRTYRASSNSPN